MKWMWLGALIAVLPACGEPERKSELQEALSGSIKDSSSLEFRNVAERNGLICGELNSRADHGTDRKFKAFVFDRAQNVLRTEDEQEPDEVSAFYNDLRSRCSNGSKLLNEIHSRKDDGTGG